MGDARHLVIDFDRVIMAMRAELAEQAERAATIAEALKAEVARLEADKATLAENLAFWRRQAILAQGRAAAMQIEREIARLRAAAGGSDRR